MWILGLKGLRHIKREKASLPVDVCLPKTCLLKLINRELKQLRRRPQRRLQKNNRFNDQNNSSARTSRFLVHFFDIPTGMNGALNGALSRTVNIKEIY